MKKLCCIQNMPLVVILVEPSQKKVLNLIQLGLHQQVVKGVRCRVLSLQVEVNLFEDNHKTEHKGHGDRGHRISYRNMDLCNTDLVHTEDHEGEGVLCNKDLGSTGRGSMGRGSNELVDLVVVEDILEDAL